MKNLNVKTTTNGQVVLTETLINELAASLSGQLIHPGHDDYEEERAIWNGMIDKRPTLIARCAGVADVIEAVNFARLHNLLLAVRGGGHNVAGQAMRRKTKRCGRRLVTSMSGWSP